MNNMLSVLLAPSKLKHLPDVFFFIKLLHKAYYLFFFYYHIIYYIINSVSTFKQVQKIQTILYVF